MQKYTINVQTGEQEIVDLTPEEVAAAKSANAAWEAQQATYVPPQVPMWAVRTVLQNDGLFEQAQALIDASGDNALKNAFEYGNHANRDSASINSLAAALGLSSQQVDQMFRDANALSI